MANHASINRQHVVYIQQLSAAELAVDAASRHRLTVKAAVAAARSQRQQQPHAPKTVVSSSAERRRSLQLSDSVLSKSPVAVFKLKSAGGKSQSKGSTQKADLQSNEQQDDNDTAIRRSRTRQLPLSRRETAASLARMRLTRIGKEQERVRRDEEAALLRRQHRQPLIANQSHGTGSANHDEEHPALASSSFLPDAVPGSQSKHANIEVIIERIDGGTDAQPKGSRNNDVEHQVSSINVTNRSTADIDDLNNSCSNLPEEVDDQYILRKFLNDQLRIRGRKGDYADYLSASIHDDDDPRLDSLGSVSACATRDVTSEAVDPTRNNPQGIRSTSTDRFLNKWNENFVKMEPEIAERFDQPSKSRSAPIITYNFRNTPSEELAALLEANIVDKRRTEDAEANDN